MLKGVTFKRRYKDRAPENGLGPQTYYPFVRKRSPCYTFSSRSQDPENQCASPGPGYYELSSTRSPKIRIGTAERFNQTTRSGDHYTIQDPAHIIAGPKFTFGQKLRIITHNEVPGPGCYKIDGITPGSALPFTSRQTQRRNLQEPGPGHYDIPENKHCIKVSMAKSCRHEEFNFTPGPGQYTINVIRHKNAKRQAQSTFSRARRGTDPSTISTPGPCDYQIPRSRGVSVTIQNFHYGRSAPITPGPGQYNIFPEFRKNAANFTDSARTKFIKELNVGPGSYDLDKY